MRSRAQVTIVNRSTLVTAADLARMVPAWQRGVDYWVAAHWGVSGDVRLAAPGEVPQVTDWLIDLVDRCPDQADVSYHDVLRTDVPHGIVGLQTAIAEGVAPSAAIFHELAEMLVDPRANRLMQAGPRVYWLEVCDPVAGSAAAIDGIALEAVVTEDYYLLGSRGPWDSHGLLAGPLTLTGGGYLMSATIGGDFGQQNAPLARPSRRVPHWLSRRGRRLAGWHARPSLASAAPSR